MTPARPLAERLRPGTLCPPTRRVGDYSGVTLASPALRLASRPFITGAGAGLACLTATIRRSSHLVCRGTPFRARLSTGCGSNWWAPLGEDEPDDADDGQGGGDERVQAQAEEVHGVVDPQ